MVKTGKGGQLAKRRGNIFGKVGIIVIIIMAGMSIMGVAHGAWKSTVSIPATVETGDWGVGLIVTSWSPEINNATSSGDTLTIDLTGTPDGEDYSVSFTIANTGSIPIKIQTIDYTIPEGVTNITNSIVVGLQLDANDGQIGNIVFDVVTDDTGVSDDFIIQFNAIQWNQYVP